MASTLMALGDHLDSLKNTHAHALPAELELLGWDKVVQGDSDGQLHVLLLNTHPSVAMREGPVITRTKIHLSLTQPSVGPNCSPGQPSSI